MKKKLLLVLIALLMLILPAVALADTGGTVDTTVVGILINIGRHAEEIEFDAHAQMVRNAAQRI